MDLWACPPPGGGHLNLAELSFIARAITHLKGVLGVFYRGVAPVESLYSFSYNGGSKAPPKYFRARGNIPY
jgi:hypothetical protein